MRTDLGKMRRLAGGVTASLLIHAGFASGSALAQLAAYTPTAWAKVVAAA